ncbi:hypothetical protein [Bradyrhizobium sp. HKCCYLRH1062]|uniref:hypothetical protein n=1 Tax=unclassified Bradyrhizobium TaxID=2631580 RepID=UPI003EB91085
MPGAALILFLSRGIGAIALGLRIVFGRSRVRSQAILATAHSARHVTEPPSAGRDEKRASPEPAGTAGRGGLGGHTEPESVPPARERDAGNSEERFALPLAANPAAAAQSSELKSEDAQVPAILYGAEGTYATGRVATAETDSRAAEILASLESESELAVLSETDDAVTLEGGQEKLPDLATAVDEYKQPAAAPDESAGVEPSARKRQDSCGAPLSPQPEELPLTQNDGDVAVANGDVGSAAAVTSDSLSGVCAERDVGPTAEGLTQHCCGLAFEQQPDSAAGVDDLTAEPIESDLAALSGTGAEQPWESAQEAPAEIVPASRPRPSKPAKHRDRRGQRRPAHPKVAVAPGEASPAPSAVLRTPAEARLRLIIHPVRRTVSISAVLVRPAGYPDSITLLLGAGTEIGAYGEDRYDDVDLDWTPSLLSGEVRLDSREGYQWLRSSRRIHIFSEQVNEQGLISVGSATLNSTSAVVCAQEDAEPVRSAAAACGSSQLVSHDRWTGVPEGWAVLSGYRPSHAASMPLDPYLTTLDPGVGAEIRLSGGLPVRSGSFAQGSPPRIEIQPFPAGAEVTIDGRPAEVNDDGCWRAEGWDRPGDHLVDVVPGPSLKYRILGDPWTEGGWESWDAHSGRFPVPNDSPWARTQICGARVSGPAGEHVVAAEAMSSVIALGLRRGVAMLRVRPDAPVAVGLLREVPAFLISSSGPRRIQGRVDWLAPPSGERLTRAIDPSWVAVIRSAASRRLPFSTDSPAGQEAWRRARTRARRYWRAGA